MPTAFCNTMKNTVSPSKMASGLPPANRSLKLALIPIVVKKYTKRMSRALKVNSTLTPPAKCVIVNSIATNNPPVTGSGMLNSLNIGTT